MVDRVQVPAEEGLQDGAPKADNAENNDLILGKFKSYDDSEKSYKELEAKLGQQRNVEEEPEEEPLPDQKPRAEDEWQPETPEGDEQNQVLPGFSQDKVEEMSTYAWENGSLTDDHYAELENAGYSREIVDAFMRGQFAQAEASQAQLLNAGGGEQKVQQMFEWAEKNLSQDQIEQYNSRFDQGGPDAIMAMEHLAAKYDASGESGGRRVSGANAPVRGPEPFRSVDQVREAMSDPRYQSDPAYREDVARRLARSNVL